MKPGFELGSLKFDTKVSPLKPLLLQLLLNKKIFRNFDVARKVNFHLELCHKNIKSICNLIYSCVWAHAKRQLEATSE